jgi:hypothetical protein
MSGQKIAKNLPKRAASAHLKDSRKRRWATGKERKAARVALNEAQAKANVAAGKTPKQRIRPRIDRDGHLTNIKVCNRCHKRAIVAGSVCWCRSIGEGWG